MYFNLLLYFLSLSAIAYSFKPGPMYDMGPYSTIVKLGPKLPPKYTPLNERDVQAAKNVLPLLEAIFDNETIRGGIDPLERNHVGPFFPPFLSGPTNLTNLRVLGLGGLKIEELEIRVLDSSKSSIRVDSVLYDADVQGESFFNTTAKLDFDLLPFSGYIRIIIKDLRVTSQARLDLQNTESPEKYDFYKVTGAEVNVNAGNVQLQLYLPGRAKLQNNKILITRGYNNSRQYLETVFEKVVEEINKVLKAIPKEDIWDVFDS